MTHSTRASPSCKIKLEQGNRLAICLSPLPKNHLQFCVVCRKKIKPSLLRLQERLIQAGHWPEEKTLDSKPLKILSSPTGSAKTAIMGGVEFAHTSCKPDFSS